MSGANGSRSGLTRRSFLKSTGTAMGVVAAAGVAGPSMTALAEQCSIELLRTVFRPSVTPLGLDWGIWQTVV